MESLDQQNEEEEEDTVDPGDHHSADQFAKMITRHGQQPIGDLIEKSSQEINRNQRGKSVSARRPSEDISLRMGLLKRRPPSLSDQQKNGRHLLPPIQLPLVNQMEPNQLSAVPKTAPVFFGLSAEEVPKRGPALFSRSATDPLPEAAAEVGLLSLEVKKKLPVRKYSAPLNNNNFAAMADQQAGQFL